MKYSLIYDNDELFCLGVYDSLQEAIGEAILNASDFGNDNYSDEGEEFYISPLQFNENGSGYSIKITFKAKIWDKPLHNYYHILTSE